MSFQVKQDPGGGGGGEEGICLLCSSISSSYGDAHWGHLSRLPSGAVRPAADVRLEWHEGAALYSDVGDLTLSCVSSGKWGRYVKTNERRATQDLA